MEENKILPLRLENVTTGYRVKGHAVPIGRNYIATLPAGAVTCLLGVNGSGKSTLLRSLSKSQPILEGEIYVGDDKLSSLSNREIGKKIGIVLTDNVEAQNMSVYELLALGRAPYSGFWGRLSSMDKSIVEESLNYINIQHLRDRRVCSLSDGERQKVMVAKALVQQTPVILLDEPTAFLDYPSRLELMMLLTKLAHNDGKTILLSTHDIPLAMQMSDNIWLVNGERKLICGKPQELAINGEIGRSFDRAGIEYDPQTNSFIRKSSE